EGIMYVSGSAATSFLPYVGQAKYLKLLKGEKSKNKANGIRSAVSRKTTESLQRIDGRKKENSLWRNNIKNSGKQYVQEVTHFFRKNFMPNPSFQLSTANQSPINVWSRATIENRMDSIVPASLRKVEGKGTTKGIDKTRPSWRQSEIDVGKEYPGYRDQVSYKEGNEVSHGTKNSSRPDFYIDGHSIEVKNYKVTTSSGRSNLIRNVSKQINKRISDLPEQTKQSVIIDVRGQNVSRDVLRDIKQKINERTNDVAEIIFKMD
ncbi:hypothetical protein ACBP97_24950, partial [Niallia circulans]